MGNNIMDQLKTAAADLNSASDRLNAVADAFDANIKSLNIGLEVWVPFENEEFGDCYVGYAKISTRWGLSLSAGHEADNEWYFKDAPRPLRLAALAHIDDLLRQLTIEAESLAEEINGKVSEFMKEPVP